jgi:hypothetical protein
MPFRKGALPMRRFATKETIATILLVLNFADAQFCWGGTPDPRAAEFAANLTRVENAFASSAQISGLDYPSNEPFGDDLRFRFVAANLVNPYPATYVWRIRPRQQAGYYTTFFWGPDGDFTGTSFYGAHPYPDGGSTGTTHKWEISIEGEDDVVDEDGHSTQVIYEDWYQQALVVRVVNTDEIEATFYWDLPDTSKRIVHTTQFTDYATTFGSPPYPGKGLSFGDAPWSIGNERLSGILRGIQIYAATLTLVDISAEIENPLSSVAGSSSIWYLNINPTPDDISDHSGQGHHPAWASSARPTLWVDLEDRIFANGFE